MEQREIYERFKRGAGARAKRAFKAARLIQKRWRGVLGRRKALLRQVAVTRINAAKLIQCAYRMYLAKILLLSYKRSIVNTSRIAQVCCILTHPITPCQQHL